MSFWKFVGLWFARAFEFSWKGGHIVHQICVYLSGFLVLLSIWLGVHGGEPNMLIAAPLMGAILIFLAGLVWQAYKLYRDEFDKRHDLEKKLAASFRIEDARRVAVKKEWEQLTRSEQAAVERLIVMGPQSVNNLVRHLRDERGLSIEGKDLDKILHDECSFVIRRDGVFYIVDDVKPSIQELIAIRP